MGSEEKRIGNETVGGGKGSDGAVEDEKMHGEDGKEGTAGETTEKERSEKSRKQWRKTDRCRKIFGIWNILLGLECAWKMAERQKRRAEVETGERRAQVFWQCAPTWSNEKGIKSLSATELVRRSLCTLTHTLIHTLMHTHTHMLIVTQTCATQRLTLQGGQTQGDPRERQCVWLCVSVCVCLHLWVTASGRGGQNNKQIWEESGTEKQTAYQDKQTISIGLKKDPVVENVDDRCTVDHVDQQTSLNVEWLFGVFELLQLKEGRRQETQHQYSWLHPQGFV